MLLSNSYLNPDSQLSRALVEPLRVLLTQNRLKSVDVSVEVETPRGILNLHYDVMKNFPENGFAKLQHCYQKAMQRANASGAQAVLSLAVNVVYLAGEQENRVNLQPQANVIDLRNLQPTLELDAET